MMFECCQGGDKCPISPSGDPKTAEVVVVGEAPGVIEIRDGIPFVGKSGSLLRDNLALAGLNNIYLTNSLMWRPPDDRNPKIPELNACRTRLYSDIYRANPKLVLALGNYGMAGVLNVKPSGITTKRGTHHKVDILGRETDVILSVHPAYVLRVPSAIDDFKADLRLVKEFIEGSTAGTVEPPWENYFIIDDQPRFDALIRRLKTVKAMSIDVETIGLSPDGPDNHLLSVALSWKRETAVVIDVREMFDPYKGRETNLYYFNEAIKGIRCAFHNAQFDVPWLNKYGIHPDLTFDTMLAHYCLDERKGTHSLKKLASGYYRAPEYDGDLKDFLKDRGVLGKPQKEHPVPEFPEDLEAAKPKEKSKTSDENEDRKEPLVLTQEAWRDDESRHAILKYNAADADYTYRLAEDLSTELRQNHLRHVHNETMIPAAKHFMWLEREGIKVDVDYQNKIGQEWLAEREGIEDQLRQFDGAGDINFNSWQQLRKYLYETLNLDSMKARNPEKLTTDEVFAAIQSLKEPDPNAVEYWAMASSAVFSDMHALATNSYMLHWLGHQHPFPRLMTKYRDVNTKIKNYIYGWREFMRWDRLHPRQRIHGTRTGRMSSTEPNIHGTPRDKHVQNMLIADEGYEVVYIDYSQAEIRMLAYLSGDETLAAACSAPGGVHRNVSLTLFGLTSEEMDKLDKRKVEEMRRAAKTIAFGIIYGRGAKSLAPQMGTSIEETEGYREAFLNGMPRANIWIKTQVRRSMRLGYSETLQGFRRRYSIEMAEKSYKHKGEVERQSVNQPIQGSVSMMTTEANLEVHKQIPEALPWPHIHDGFGVQVPQGMVEDAIPTIINICHEAAPQGDVKFDIELKRGHRWGELESVFEG